MSCVIDCNIDTRRAKIKGRKNIKRNRIQTKHLQNFKERHLVYSFYNKSKVKHAYHTHWLECWAIAIPLLRECSFTKHCIVPFVCSMVKNMDNQISTGPLYLRKILVLT